MTRNRKAPAISVRRDDNLVEMLLKAERITIQQMEHAVALAQKLNRPTVDVLFEQGLVSPEDMVAAVSLRLNVPVVDLKRHQVHPDALRLVPEQTARKYDLIPLDIVGDSLVVVMADPGDIQAAEDVATQAKMPVQPAIGVLSEVREAIDLNYKLSGQIEQQLSELAPPSGEGEEAGESGTLVAETPVVRTLDLLIAQAIKDRASDIHIEPQENRLRIRYRIDGVLHDTTSLPLAIHEAVISRLKILARMNITEHRRPQDGQLSFQAEGKDVDVRVATCETAHGETMVLRILDKSLSLFTLPELGFLPDALKLYREMLKSPLGMILVSGPTGSGKTTTLYASINQLDRNELNILTIEDPIEYRFIDIKQIQVNPKAGITFASGLRAIMRLDPDVILVGEIRDVDTAKTGVQAALTGHLVLSSIHANDAVGVLFRLIDLGVEPYLLASAVVGIVAQRMVRRICRHCREPYQPPLAERIAYEEEMGRVPTTFYAGAGCNLCANTGYLGRTGVFEVLPFSEEARRMLLQGASASEIRAQALREGMTSLRRDGMLKAKEGITTVHEVLRNVFSIGAARSGP